MKIFYKKNYSKTIKILGPWLAFLDNLYFLDFIFWLKKRCRIITKVHAPGFELVDHCQNREELFRAKRWLTKEPDTIQWIDEYIRDGEVLYDIGANVGIYSIYAAKKYPETKVFAFEPFCMNFTKLNENIAVNHLGQRITALPVALNDREEIALLNVSVFESGASNNQFGHSLDYTGHAFKPQFQQGAIGISIDELVEKYHMPKANHIKIDVDANEPEIIQGAKKLLSGPEVKSLLIEFCIGEGITEEHSLNARRAIEFLQKMGFRLKQEADTGQFESSKNYIFVR
ncbi:MAG: FkbM family methyltransferase [Candidatus Omnitrophica bacterium]|nr:FkbM family methyltransferase [Candidatus Omnitrophota bacterium]